MSKRKSAALWLGAVLLTGSSVACSSQTNSADGGKAAGEAVKAMPKVYIYQNSGVLNARPEGSTPEKLEEMKKYYMEKLNIDATAYVPPKSTDAANQKLNLMLGSGGDELDMFYGNWDDYAASGAIQPINEFLDKYGQDIKKAWTKEAWDLMTDKEGKIWGVPRGIPVLTYPVWARTDWLKKLNLPSPKNFDELENVLKAFRDSDPDGDGKDDTICLMTDLIGLRMAFAGGFVEGGYGNWLDPKDNKIKPVELAPGYKDFVVKMADWYKKGYIYKEAFGKFDPLELLKTGRVGASTAWYSRITLLWPQVQGNFPGADYEILRGITGPQGKIQTVSPAGTAGQLIPKKSKHPDTAIQFLNYQYKDLPTNAITAKFGLNWKYVDDKKFNIEVMDKEVLYAGEYSVSLGLATEAKYAILDPVRQKHADYLINEATKLDTAKTPIDSAIVYNKAELLQNIPNSGDLTRLCDEETVKFITGARPISEWDNFIDQLNKAGLDKWINEYSRQYQKLKK